MTYRPVEKPTKGQRRPTRSQYGGRGGYKDAWFHQYVCNDAHYQGTLAFAEGKGEDEGPQHPYPDDPDLEMAVHMLWNMGWREGWWGKLADRAFGAIATVCREELGRYPELEAILDELTTKQVIMGVNGIDDAKYEIAWREWKPGLTRDDEGVWRR